MYAEHQSNVPDPMAAPHLAYPQLPQMSEVPWTYEMRREAQEIIPNLYLGPYASATKRQLDALKALGIRHIVCVRQAVEQNLIRPNFPSEFNYLVVEMADDCLERIIPQCKTVCEFLTNCLNNGEKVLVHGNGGVSRSATLVIAFIMFRFGVSAEEAQRHVQQQRFCINPNENFVAQLKEFEPIYKAYTNVNGLHHSLAGSGSGSNKRTRDCRDAQDYSGSAPFSFNCTNIGAVSSGKDDDEDMIE